MGSKDDHSIVHLYADVGVEDEVLSAYGDVTRVGIDPEPNPFSEVVRADATKPPFAENEFDLALLHPPCQKFSMAGGDPDDHVDLIPDARSVGKKIADHYIIENVPQAPLCSPVELSGYHFGKPVPFRRAFETSFRVESPQGRAETATVGPLEGQGETSKQWVGKTDGWQLSKGYSHDWPGKALKRHGIPRAYIEHLLYYWLTAVESGERSEQATLELAYSE